MARKRESRPSEKQLEVLEFIITHVCERGYQPTRNQMAASFGVTRNAITQRLRLLAEHGLIGHPEEGAGFLDCRVPLKGSFTYHPPEA